MTFSLNKAKASTGGTIGYGLSVRDVYLLQRPPQLASRLRALLALVQTMTTKATKTVHLKVSQLPALFSLD